MKRVSVVTSGALALAASGQAVAVTPDSKNPAHCLAAFNYANYWFKVGHSPDDARAMMARGIFELNKIKATGGSVAVAKDEATELTKAHADNEKQMDALFVACGSAQDADPQFKAQLPALLAEARKAEAERQ